MAQENDLLAALGVTAKDAEQLEQQVIDEVGIMP
jgi:hypothetical protein